MNSRPAQEPCLIRKIENTGGTHRKPGSGRPRHARPDGVVDQAEYLVLSQEDAPQSHSSQRQIAKQVGIFLTSVNTIIKNDLQLKCHKKRRAHELTEGNKKKRFDCCRRLLKRYPAETENFIWFTDEKLFTVATANLKMIAFTLQSVFERRTLHRATCYAVG